jgi:hypothetical protein
LPHLVRWHEKFPELKIIDIDNGTRDTPEAVEAHVKDKKIPFVVIHDDKALTTRKYGVIASPMAYLVGADGVVIWNGHPHSGLVEELEGKIAKAIEDAKTYAETKPPTEASAEEDEEDSDE